jgi:hypothetical protein
LCRSSAHLQKMAKKWPKDGQKWPKNDQKIAQKMAKN